MYAVKESLQIIVIGDVMLDMIFRTSRKAKRGFPIFSSDRSPQVTLGGAGNVARAAGTLGASPILIAAVGEDEALIHSLLSQSIVDGRLLYVPGYPTIQKLYVYCDNEIECRIDVERHFPPELMSGLVDSFDIACPSTDAILIADYSKGTITDEIRNRIRESQLPAYVQCRPWDVEKYSDWARFISMADEEWSEVPLSLLPQRRLITRSTSATYIDPEREVSVPGFTVPSIDSVGAGDVFFTAFTLGIASNTLSIRQALLYAHAAAASTTLKLGACAPDADVMDDLLMGILVESLWENF